MWSKISSVLKTRSDVDGTTTSVQEPSQTSVLGKVLEQHPNMSVFHPNQDHTLPAPSPPSSPSKYGRLGLFKRASTKTHHDNSSSVSLAKKVKATLHINTNMNDSNISLAPASATDAGLPPAYGSVRSLFHDRNRPSAAQVNGDMLRLDNGHARKSVSVEVEKDSPALATGLAPLPLTPLDSQRAYGSVRSILRDRNTPSSGQNVRFFSRDAYRVISPDSSINNSTSNQQEPSFKTRLQDLSAERSTTPNNDSTKFHSANDSANDLFAPLSTPPISGLSLDVHLGKNSTNFLTLSQGQASHSVSSLLVTIPPPEMTDLFDLSAAHEHNVQAIPLGTGSGLQDGAVEIDEFDHPIQSPAEKPPAVFRKLTDEEKESRPSSHSTASSISISTPNSSINGSGRSLGRKSGEVVFHSLTNTSEKRPTTPEVHALPPRSASSLGLYKLFSKDHGTEGRSSLDASTSTSNRARAQSELLFRPPALDDAKFAVADAKKSRPEADINDTSVADVVLYDSRDISPLDPFNADARNYYTADAGIPNSPPKLAHARSDSGGSGSGASMKSTSCTSQISSKSQASKVSHRSHSSRLEEDDLLLSLRTQLAFHQELSSQYEVDLSARDELVTLLNSKLKKVEDESEKRAKAARSARKKVAELERACRTLEQKVDQSKQESFERSIMDEASGEALRQLHRQINQLEREKGDAEKREQELLAENERLKEDVNQRERVQRSLQDGIEDAKAQMEAMRDADQSMERGVEDVRFMMVKGEQEYAEEAERHRATEFAWDEERTRLVGQLAQMESLQEQLNAKENEVEVLKKEVEAQWTNTENLTGRIEELERDNEGLEKETGHLKNEIAALEARTSEMEMEWTESENRRGEVEAELADAWLAREEAEKERDELHAGIDHARAQLNEVRNKLESTEALSAALKQERDFADENAARVENLLREREEELSHFAQKVAAKEQLLDSLHDQLSSLKREHVRLGAEQARTLSGAGTREADIQKQLEEAIRSQTEAQMASSSLKERVDTLQNEVETFRRQVHLLKQQSADQDVKIVQMQRQHELEKEDKLGLNIALDSKQQELELLKRKLGVCGTAGSTPAAPSRVGIRRESSASFATPLPIRPSSSLSDTGTKAKAAIETPSTAGKIALGRSSRANVNAPSSALKAARFNDSAMAPPAHKSRASMSSSVSATPSVSRSPSVRAGGSSVAAPVHHRRGSSSALHLSLSSKAALMRSQSGDTSDASSAQDDKENSRPTPARATPTRIARRNSLVSSPT